MLLEKKLDYNFLNGYRTKFNPFLYRTASASQSGSHLTLSFHEWWFIIHPLLCMSDLITGINYAEPLVLLGSD